MSPILFGLLPQNSQWRCLPFLPFGLLDFIMVHEELPIYSGKNWPKMTIFSNKKCPILRMVLIKMLYFCPATSHKTVLLAKWA